MDETPVQVMGEPERKNISKSYIKRLYTIDESLCSDNLCDDEFVARRKALAALVLEKIRAWLEKRSLQVPPSLLLGKAIRYTLNEWPKLVRYLDSPYLPQDNNVVERAIRPFVIVRKNWLFTGSPKGGDSSCAMYSLIETAKQNEVNPNDYLRKVFEMTPIANSAEEWENLLPWNIGV